MILRRASIAPTIVGIAFSSSFGVWKRCAGSFSSYRADLELTARMMLDTHRSKRNEQRARVAGVLSSESGRCNSSAASIGIAGQELYH